MTTVLLVRHGLTAVTGSILLGWTPGVGLDDRGRAQAGALAGRLASVPLTAVVSSPLQRCRETAEAIVARQRAAAADQGEGTQDGQDGDASRAGPGTGTNAEGGSGTREWDAVTLDDRLGECHYGDWTGQETKVLTADPLWRTVQDHPSAVVFPGPGGEALRDTQHRAVTAVRDWNARLGPAAVWLACSHGDVIKAIVADAMGIHLDLFQRILIDPCSLTIIRYTERRPFVIRVNDRGGSVADLLPAPWMFPADKGDAVVGGGA
ncbi:MULTISPECIES: histidine phosphatase family protein [Protofrankia]|uniref:Phosphoglycerate mutase n=1 Tax=Protofrankia coriariae TaxID=1562887 RepID=A0ABR5F2U3_9ACTN|nr:MULTISPECIES: histidine phosphatase family protein [Protofrankia]KLL11025.1 phosphoglycerate mutase [Protofrankia coriariae]ONH33959.1 phosphoglycerate mutase [Protofrankia sp. BMG5.30]